MAENNQSKTVVKKKTFKNIADGRLYVKSTFNNTLVSVTDTKGKVLTWSSAGNCGFKGSRKSTPFAATTATFIQNIAIKTTFAFRILAIIIIMMNFVFKQNYLLIDNYSNYSTYF